MTALVDAAQDLVAWMERLLAAFPPLKVSRVPVEPFALIGRSVLVRQSAALKGALLLAEAGMGQMGLPMVRPACDELIWVKYLCSLEEDERGALLHVINAVESARTVNAQQQHLGNRTMQKIGFPKGFVKTLTRQRVASEAGLKKTGVALGWPQDLHHLPPGAGWLAGQVGLSDLYAFLYSASSKGVHFSVTEHMRSGYFSGEPDAEVHLDAPTYVAYRSGFVVYWLCYLLVKTAAAVAEVLPEFREAQEGQEEEEENDDFLPIIKRVTQYGKVPIVMPFEFNLGRVTRN